MAVFFEYRLLTWVTHSRSLQKFECKYTLRKHTKPLNTLKLSGDARMLLSGGDDGQLLIWNVTKGSLHQAILVVFNGPVCVAIWTPISPEGPMTSFAFGCADGRVFVYQRTDETGSYRLSCSIPAHNNHIEALAFDMNHHRLASVGTGTAKVWQIDSDGHLKLLHALTPKPFVVRSVDFLD
ncbi:uncharacterized protein LACBIDRAFT_299895 [Laccaria bicolor S238N-H82]|uniref:Predicted protein n=1 Tax=Laccaria bicolor (strain S238N-H82 / ATCC MYA-4686) TaxID=486041 RepID=B0E3T0_LACBS|nr:uncharacterized protein LACBIDRAFT_299895 [Laccaria bicolor S238N-H82]EDQ98501.1 predicted protein [Laccaria bicolor S238N-H82]|eukprot:XP_001890848.1 predicted protein [Laccaria bicolor S238N-H82]